MYPGSISYINIDGFTVYYTRIESGLEWPLPCLRILDREDEQKIMKLRDDRMRREFILERCFRRSILGSVLKVEPAEICFRRNESGKPGIEGFSHVHFNATRTKGWAAMAVGQTPVGIDIERISGESPKTNLIQYLNQYRSNDLVKLPVDINETDFLNWWVANEAVQKLKGINMEEFGWAYPFNNQAQHDFRLAENLNILNIEIEGLIGKLAFFLKQ